MIQKYVTLVTASINCTITSLMPTTTTTTATTTTTTNYNNNNIIITTTTTSFFISHGFISGFIGERNEPLSMVFNDQPRDIYIYMADVRPYVRF